MGHFLLTLANVPSIHVIFQLSSKIEEIQDGGLKGALSQYFSVILQCRNMFLHQWKPKNNDAVLLSRTLSLHRNHLLLPIT